MELTDKDLRDIDDAAAHFDVQGDRYPEDMQRLIDR